MSDINNPGDLNNLRPQMPIQRNSNPDPTPAAPNTPQPKSSQIENDKILNGDPASFLGRSLVKGKYAVQFSGETYENLKKDLDVLNKNADVVTASDKVFDIAFNGTNSYSQAANMQVAYVNEFKNAQ